MLKYLFFLLPILSFSNEAIIIEVKSDLPMGEKDEVIKKNYYINMGKDQGIYEGTFVEVFRIFPVVDPYNTQKSYRYNIKIGDLKIIHAEVSQSIAIQEGPLKNQLVLESNTIQVGDQIKVKLED